MTHSRFGDRAVKSRLTRSPGRSAPRVAHGGARPPAAGDPADPSGAHQPRYLVSSDAIAGASGGEPQLARPVDPVVRRPQRHQHHGHRRMAASPSRHRPRLGVVVARRGDRQLRADRLDPEVFAAGVDEGHHHLCGRSSSAAKKADADFKIAFARRSSRTSCSRTLSRSRSPVVVPGRPPSSMSA